MHCTCERARREARAEAFAEAAAHLSDEAGEARRMGEHAVADEMGVQAARLFSLAEATTAKRESAGSPVRMDIVDCVEDDGFITAHVTDTAPRWPCEDGGLDG